jgi:hypothetical protein
VEGLDGRFDCAGTKIPPVGGNQAKISRSLPFYHEGDAEQKCWRVIGLRPSSLSKLKLPVELPAAIHTLPLREQRRIPF